jgi:large subunit ribosomal protein L31
MTTTEWHFCKGLTMKKNIHPEIFNVAVRCACGHSFDSISTSNRLEVDICSNCHPLYTGQQKFIDTAGRIEKFEARFNKKQK